MGRTITVVKPIQVCKECNTPFPNAHRLNLHMKDAHRKPQPKPELIIPPMMAPGQPSSSNIFMQFPPNPMMNLVQKNGGGGAKKYVCNTCSKVFKKACKLKRHLAVHMIVKPFPCLLCDKRFGRKDHLRGHVRAVTSHADTCACERCRVHYSCNIDVQITKYFTAKRSCKGEESVACTCSICKEELLDMAALKMHFRVEHFEKAKFLLDSGNAMFKSPAINMVPNSPPTTPKKVSAKDYVKMNNRQIISQWFCGHCERTFSEKHLMEEHICQGKVQPDKGIVVKVVMDGEFSQQRDAIDGGGDREQASDDDDDDDMTMERTATKRRSSMDDLTAGSLSSLMQDTQPKRPKRIIRYSSEEAARMLVRPTPPTSSSLTPIQTISAASLLPISALNQKPVIKLKVAEPLLIVRKNQPPQDGADYGVKEEWSGEGEQRKPSESLLRAQLSQGSGDGTIAMFKRVQGANEKITIAASNIKTSTWGLKDRLPYLKKIAQTESGPFLCDQCPREFPYIEGKIAHEMMHLHGSTRDIICTICKIKVRDHSKMVRHLRKHTGSKPFVCEQCGKRFARNDHRNIHATTTCNFKRFVPHPSDVPLFLPPQPLTPKDANTSGGSGVLFECKVEVHRCKKCERSFTKRANLIEHKCHLSEDEDDFVLDEEDDNSSLSEEVDDVYKPFVCQPCDLAFFEECDLNAHIMECHEDQPFYCSLCETGWDAGDDLVAHYNQYHANLAEMESMMNDEPITCKPCSLTFATITAFSTHMVDVEHKKRPKPVVAKTVVRTLTSSLKLFERCSHCQKVLPNELELREHMLAEH